jgi:hypothetical protein
MACRLLLWEDTQNFLKNGVMFVTKYSPKKPLVFVAFLLAAFAFVANAGAQELVKNSAVPPQDAGAKLATLPEADTLMYVSPRRILTEAAPRVMPAKDLENMSSAFAEIKKKAGIDPRTVDYIVIQSRFKKPTDDLRFMLPDFMLVASGDFDGAALIQLIREETKGKLREETYNSKTIYLITIDDVARQAEKMPILKSLSEVAISLLNGDTIAVGTTSYVKAAVDAADGKGRISTDLLNSVLRDPTALASTAGSPLTAFAKTFALLGTENRPRDPKCDVKLGDYYASITMEGTSFKIRGAMNADNPDTAKIIKSLLSMGLEAVISNVKDSQAQTALRALTITPTETEVLLQADISQQAVADFIRDATAPKKKDEAASSATAPETKRKPTTRRRRRAVKKP